ncbi:hypothetical protein WICPIJ_001005 [Wickerhamomyces pijperi]|uniref:Pre-mRNA-splicing factor SYF2 n=1 Tax=Wickerhamomyces pijperi TaxID=599730 RepID=A0A9P8TRS8_WICPI|nr:hypothetical protein WICPIJ_001005 [Wickerhamomyces pijperi]
MNNDQTPTVQDRLAKLKQLQKRKAQSSKTNRRELYLEQKKQNPNSKTPLPSHSLDKQIDEKDQQKAQRLKNLDYTLEQSEEWEQKQQEKKDNQTRSGFQDYSQLAERAYRKEVSHLGKSTLLLKSGPTSAKSKTQIANTASKKQLQQLSKYSSDSSDSETEAQEDFTNKPNNQAIESLVSSLDASSSRKYKSRMEQRAKNEAQGLQEGVIGASTKERDFVMKLGRYLGDSGDSKS